MSNEFILLLKIGIIKHIHQKKMINDKQMERAIREVREQHKNTKGEVPNETGCSVLQGINGQG